MSSREPATGPEPLLHGLAVRLRDKAACWLAGAGTAGPEPDLRPTLCLYMSVGLVAGTLIALQIAIMRIFAAGSSAHFGSMAVSLAMLGFGLASAVMCIGKGWFERNWPGVARVSLLLFGPLIVAANLAAQQIPVNAALVVIDPAETWRLAGNFLLYMLPFLPGAFFLGTVFLKAQRSFGRIYFADLTGSGLCGLVVLAAVAVVPPEHLLLVPLLLWLAGSVLWFIALGRMRGVAWVAAAAAPATSWSRWD